MASVILPKTARFPPAQLEIALAAQRHLQQQIRRPICPSTLQHPILLSGSARFGAGASHFRGVCSFSVFAMSSTYRDPSSLPESRAA